MLLACVTIPKSVGHFLLDSDKIMIGQTYGLNDDTQQLNLNGCAEVWNEAQHKTKSGETFENIIAQ